MRRIRVRRKTVSLTVLALFPLVFLAASFHPFRMSASDNSENSMENVTQKAAARWNPRRVPAGTEFAGDQVCAECHRTKVSSHTQSGMGMAMEAIADSKVLTENPAMKFQKGPYTFEIKRQGKQSIYSVSDGRDTI